MWFAPWQEFLFSYRKTLGLNVMPFLKFSWQKHRFPKQQCNSIKTHLKKHCCPLTAFSKGQSPTDSSLTTATARCEHGGVQGYRGSLQHHGAFICNEASLDLHFCEGAESELCTLDISGRILAALSFCILHI